MWGSHTHRMVVARRRPSLSLGYGQARRQLLLHKLPVQESQPRLSQQLNSQTPTLFYSRFSIGVSPKSPFYQNPRFLSLPPSLNPSAANIGEAQMDVTLIDAAPARNLFDEIPSSSISSASPSPSSPLSDQTLDGNTVFEDNTSSSFSPEFLDQGPLASASFHEATDDDLKAEFFPAGNDVPVVENEVNFEQLQSVLSLLQSSATSEGPLDSALESMGLSLNEEFVVRVLETPLVPGHNLIAFFKWVMNKPEFLVSTRSVGALVRPICSELRRKNAYALWDVVQELGDKQDSVLNTEILNELISLLSRLGKGKAAFEVFNKFGELGCEPNADTYYLTIEALTRRSLYDWACSVCEKMLGNDKLPNSERTGKVISSMCKGSKAKDAHVVYLSAKEKERYPPQSSVNYLIGSLCQEDETVRLALEIAEDFKGEKRKYAIKPFSSVVQGLCRIKDVKTAKELLLKMIDAGPPPGNALFNTVINGFSKAGDMDEAMEMLKVMENRGLKPDVYTYSVIMSGYVRGGAMEEACKVLAEAKKKHSKLSPVTYHTLIRGYCKLEQFDKALELLNEMKEFGVQPNADEYNKLIQSLCLKAVDWATAEKLVKDMKESGLHLNGITKGLIRAVKELEEEGLKTYEA